MKLETEGVNMKDLKPGSLDGVTVLDFTWVLAGPFAARLLADMGAKVIKVEAYKGGANERYLPLRATKNDVTQDSYSINVNRGKRSICVNLKNPEGIKIIHKLIKKSDVVMENFAPGVMARLKLDYETVKKIKEDIIYCSISCFGHWGPLYRKPGYDIIAQAASGWTAQADVPQLASCTVGDTTGAVHAAMAITAALLVKKRKGIGQNIDISMTDCLFASFENVPAYTLGQAVGEKVEIQKMGRLDKKIAPRGVFQGKDGMISIECPKESDWLSLVKIMGDKYAWLQNDPQAKDADTRNKNAALVNQAVDEWVMSQDSVEAVQKLLEKAQVPCLRVKGVVELVDTDPQIKARDMMPDVEQPFIGLYPMIGSPVKMSETPSVIRGYSPMLGEHNVDVLVNVLGYSEEQANALYGDANVLYHEPAVDRMEKPKN